MIAERKAARVAGDYAGADRIRDELLAAGIELKTPAKGTRWRKICRRAGETYVSRCHYR